MEGRQKYRIERSLGLINDYAKIIVALYMPLIGANACCLYLLLTSEKQYESYQRIERLCALTGLDIYKLEDNIQTLQQYKLLRVFNNEDKYLFKVESPLTGKEFFENEHYARIYMNKVGKQEFVRSKNCYGLENIQEEGFVEIVCNPDYSFMDGWNGDDEKEYRESNNRNIQIAIDFDYDKFFEATSDLILPTSLRNDQNIKQIGRLATLYCISPKDMKVCVKKAMDYENNILDLDKLKTICLNSRKVEIKEGIEQDQQGPIAYLYSKQNVPVSVADKKLLEYLQVDIGFSKELVNCLIDYVLEKNNGELNKNYVEKIATTWVRQKVDSVEKAKEIIKNSFNSQPKTTKQKTVYTKDEMDVDEQNIDELRSILFPNGGKNEKD